MADKPKLKKSATNIDDASIKLIRKYLALHKSTVSVSDIKEILVASAHPSTDRKLKEIFERQDFRTTVGKIPGIDFDEGLLPCLAFTKEGDLVLIESADKRSFSLRVSGQKRKQKIPKSDIFESISGTIIKIEKGFEPKNEISDRLKNLSPLGGLGILNFSWVAIASLLSNFMGLASSIFIMVVYDRVIPNQADQTLYALAIGVGIAIIFDIILKSARSRIIEHATYQKDKSVSDKIFDQFVEAKSGNSDNSVGALSTVIRDYEVYKDFVSSASILLFIDLPFIFLFIYVISIIGDQLFIVPLLCVPIVLFSVLIVQPVLFNSSKKLSAATRSRQGLIIEILTGLDSLKSNGAFALLKNRFTSESNTFAFASNRTKSLSQISTNIVTVVQQGAQVAIIVYGFHLFVEQKISMGAIIATIILSGKTLGPLSKLAQTLGRANAAFVAYKNLKSFLKTPRRIQSETSQLVSTSEVVAVSVDNVTLRLNPEARPLFSEFSLKVKKGEKIAIIGRSGAGKTSLVKLLCGLLVPETGSLYIGGTEISGFSRANLFRSIGTVFQEPWLFSGTLRENINLGYDEIPDAKIIEALRLSGAGFLGDSAEESLDFMILDRGANLSGGQKQSICIARTLAFEPDIYVFDEPTSSMDTQMEVSFLKGLEDLNPEKTIIMVTHKPNILKACDRVVLLESGKIVWDGPLKEYAAISKSQARAASK